LLQAALLPDADARAAWTSAAPGLDLSDRRVGNADVFALVGERLATWGLDDPHLAVFSGARRRNWAASTLALGTLAEQVRAGSPSGVLVGRAATVAAYQPAPGLLGLDRPQTVESVGGPLLEVTVSGVPMRVPGPTAHLEWALRHRLWIDAAFVLRHPAMRWEDLSHDARLRWRPSIHAGLTVMRTLVGAEVPDVALAAVTPPGWVRALGPPSALAGSARQRLAGRLGRAPRQAPLSANGLP
jgi:hypothetical protein